MASIEPVDRPHEPKEEETEQALIRLESPNAENNFETKEINAVKEEVQQEGGSNPFRRWVNSFRIKKNSSIDQERYVEGWTDRDNNSSNIPPHVASLEQQWEQLSANSSHLGTVKTTTMSVTSQSLVRSRRTTQSTANKSIKSDFRGSIDSLRPALNQSIDEEAQNRAMKRRQVLREIITTESDYIFGLKALTDVLLIFSERPEVYHNVQQIREAHEGFLGRIRDMTPISNLSGREMDKLMFYTAKKRPSTVELGFKALQNRSLRTRNFKTTMNYRLKELAAETNEALEVAREIGRLSASFTAYKEFCDNYTLLTEDAALLRQSVPNWSVFEQGIEALTKSTVSIESKALYENKSLYLNDLLIKPAQRLCKYPLLLQELLKWTHIQDDPSAHDEIKQILHGVRNVLGDINEATTNTLNRALIEKTFLLQEMLEFCGTGITTLDIYKQLGPMNLCGVLHVTYQEARHITGAYMACVLFKQHLFFAEMKEEYRKLLPIACLYIDDVKIDTLSNGKGLECFCLFSWKLVFQHEDSRFEFVLSASSAEEEKRWKTEILKSAASIADVNRTGLPQLREITFVYLDLIPLECDSSTTPQLLRRPSVHSLAVSRTRSDLQHVIIRKTHCPHKHGNTHQFEGEIERPKVPSPTSAIILTTRRQDRIRLERAISPIYTRGVLPYPGMFLAAGDIIFGPNSIMRHLSLRHKRYRRSTSINLPTAMQHPNNPQSKDRVGGKMQDFGTKTRRPGSESSLIYDDEKALVPQRDRLSLKMYRSKTVKAGSSSKQEIGSIMQPMTKTNKNTEPGQSISLRAIWSMFNSMSLRRSRKNASLTLGGG